MNKTYKKRAKKMLLFLLCFEMLGYICGFFILDQFSDYAPPLRTRDLMQPPGTIIIAGMQGINKLLRQYGYSALSGILIVMFFISAITGIIALKGYRNNLESVIFQTCISKGISCLFFLPLLLYYYLYAHSYGLELIVLYLLSEMAIGFLIWNISNIYNILQKIIFRTGEI